MTLALSAVGTLATSAASNAATLDVAYAGTPASGDLLVVVTGLKPNGVTSGGSVSASGWTELGHLQGSASYGAVPASDTGNMSVYVLYKTADGTESGNLTLSLSTVHIAYAQMFLFTKSAGETFDLAIATAEYTGTATSGSNFDVTLGSDPGITAGDVVIVNASIPTDTGGPGQWTAESVTATGVTFGSATEDAEVDSTQGFDQGGVVYHATASSGTSSAAPVAKQTFTGTTTNVKGPWALTRVRAASSGLSGDILQATETDTAQAVGRLKSRTAAQATETDTAQAVGRTSSTAVAQASETDTAQAVTRNRSRTAAQAAESDSAGTVAGSKTRTAGQAAESDAAAAVTALRSVTLGTASETDSAAAVTSSKTLAVGQATETDTAQAVTASAATSVDVLQAVETDTAQAVGRVKLAGVGQAAEVDSAGAVGALRSRTLGQAGETDAAGAVAGSKRAAVGQAAETDSAAAVGALRSATLGQAGETDSAGAVDFRSGATLGRAAEVDEALPVTASKTLGVGQAVETDSAAAVSSTTANAPGAPATSSSGWWTLRGVELEAAESAQADPQLCPLSGDLLEHDPWGRLVCPFDGYRPHPVAPPVAARVTAPPDPAIEDDCPACGERYVLAPDGALVCPFDGYRPAGRRVRTSTPASGPWAGLA